MTSVWTARIQYNLCPNRVRGFASGIPAYVRVPVLRKFSVPSAGISGAHSPRQYSQLTSGWVSAMVCSTSQSILIGPSAAGAVNPIYMAGRLSSAARIGFSTRFASRSLRILTSCSSRWFSVVIYSGSTPSPPSAQEMVTSEITGGT